MTYNELKRMALQLINRYSIGGRVIPDEYNSQMDVLLEIVTLANEGMEYIATSNKRIRETCDYDMELLSVRGDNLIIPYPTDCYEMIPGGITVQLPGKPARKIRQAKRHGSDIWISLREILGFGFTNSSTALSEDETGPAGFITFDYYRHSKPIEVGEDGLPVDPDAELDNSADTHGALACYVAAHLSMYDDAYTHASLYNEWETKLARIKEEPWVDWAPVEDDYSAFNYPFY